MYSDYQIYAVYDTTQHLVYVIDFKVLRRIYKQGRHVVIKHSESETECYLLPLGSVVDNNGMLEVLEDA